MKFQWKTSMMEKRKPSPTEEEKSSQNKIIKHARTTESGKQNGPIFYPDRIGAVRGRLKPSDHFRDWNQNQSAWNYQLNLPCKLYHTAWQNWPGLTLHNWGKKRVIACLLKNSSSSPERVILCNSAELPLDGTKHRTFHCDQTKQNKKFSKNAYVTINQPTLFQGSPAGCTRTRSPWTWRPE